jgi:uroporphyrinogen decarboxylase
MPEYRAVRAQLTFLELCKHPARAAEVTLLPIEILGVDAAIVFSDILIPVEAMGMKLEFTEEGPELPEPVRTARDLGRLQVANPDRDCPWAAETIDRLLPQLGELPCLGFSGAPFTLAAYMVEGKTSKTFNKIKALMHHSPAVLHALLDLATETAIAYLRSQVRAGAAAVQLFDTWAGVLSPSDYLEFALPYQKRVFGALAGEAPTILYVNGGGTLLRQMARSGADVISLDWRTSMAEARAVLGADVPVQGNLEPAVLHGPQHRIEEAAVRVLEEAGPRGHVFNLGHGITPDVSVSAAQALVAAVQRHRHRQPA